MQNGFDAYGDLACGVEAFAIMLQPHRAREVDRYSFLLPAEGHFQDAIKGGEVEVDHGMDSSKPYDLEERTALFAEAAICFAQTIPRTPVNYRLIIQLIGAATSIGANYCEATEAVSRKDYKKSIGTCKKEAKETKFFLRMIARAEENLKPQARDLWLEARELHLIFCSLYRK